MLLGLMLSSSAWAVEEESPAGAAGGAGPALAADLSRELLLRLPADQIRWLDAESGRFPVLLRKQTLGESRGGVILLHGYYRNLDWPVVISPLRKLLSEGGWWTVSIPLPPRPPARELAPIAVDSRQPPAGDLAADAASEPEPEADESKDGAAAEEDAATPEAKADYRGIVSQRILAAVALLNGEGQFNVVLVGHESGGNWALDFFQGQTRDVVAGLVLIETANRVPGLNNEDWFLSRLAELKRRPVLDLAGASNALQENAQKRLGLARREGLAAYRHMERAAPLRGAAQIDPDLARVRAWLERNVRREMIRGRPR